MSLSTKELFFLCVLMSLSIPNVVGDYVSISNSLKHGGDLTIHCKSKDDDLGVHLLRHGQSISWNFGRNLFGNTLFYCSFQWNDDLRWFDIYRQIRDSEKCTSCYWFIKQSGPCLIINLEVQICYNWND